jgi:glycolate oxidase FAD binding subunit
MPTMTETISIDGLGPMPLARVGSVGELGELVRTASERREAIYPVGGRTMLDLGNPPTRPGTAADLSALNQVIDYPARDMTITAQAGIRLAELQRVLAGENQRLPIDVPHLEQATLGGAIACNVSGPRRFGFGTLRDYVIGISVLDESGVETKAGGRVVKNVAGYDLCKLHVGALGTLGIITQVTLKVRPRPEASAILAASVRSEQLAQALDVLHASRTRPCAIEALSPAAAAELVPDARQWSVLIGFEDNRAATNWQVETLRKELDQCGIAVLRQWHDAECEPVWHWLADWPLRGSGVSFKAALPSAKVAEFAMQLVECSPHLLAHAGDGIVLGHMSAEALQASLPRLQAQLSSWKGSFVVTRCPVDLKRAFSVWGPAREDWKLMQAIKAHLDPGNLFNPGRFVG